MPEQPCLQAAGVSLHSNDIHIIPAQSCSSITTPDSKPNPHDWKHGASMQGMTDAPAWLVRYSGIGLSVSSAPQRLASAHNTGLCSWNAASAVNVSLLSKLGNILAPERKQTLILPWGTPLQWVNQSLKVLVSLYWSSDRYACPASVGGKPLPAPCIYELKHSYPCKYRFGY